MRHHLTTPQTEAPATRVEPLDRFASNPTSGRQPAPHTVSMSRSSGSSAVASRWQVPYSLIALQAASQPSPADAGARAFGSAVSDRLVTSGADRAGGRFCIHPSLPGRGSRRQGVSTSVARSDRFMAIVVTDSVWTLATDPRADPRLVALLAQLGAADPPPAAPFTRASPREDVLAWFAGVEPRAEELFAAVSAPDRGRDRRDDSDSRSGRQRDTPLRAPSPARRWAAAVCRSPPRRRDDRSAGGKSGVRPVSRRARRERAGGLRGGVSQRRGRAGKPSLSGRLERLRDGGCAGGRPISGSSVAHMWW